MIDFKDRKTASQWSLQINAGCSDRLNRKPMNPWYTGDAHAAYCHGYWMTDQAETAAGRDISANYSKESDFIPAADVDRMELVVPGCECHFCRDRRPLSLSDIRMVVCSICGNKRCPKAGCHLNTCTGSNEPNQLGDVIPGHLDAPMHPLVEKMAMAYEQSFVRREDPRTGGTIHEIISQLGYPMRMVP